MYFAEAKSFYNGIEFYVNGKNITISVIRDDSGNLIINHKHSSRPAQKLKFKPLFSLSIAIIFAILVELLQRFDVSFKAKFMVFLGCAWFVTFAYYYFSSWTEKGRMTARYHAAEHKALNYLDKYHCATLNCMDVMKMPSISFRCGSTLIAVILVALTLCSLGILIVPFIFLKIFACILSLLATFYLWYEGKCNFLQKIVIEEPTCEEVEVATQGLWEYVKVKNE